MREEFPDKSPEWDTNQITPGTPFMVALSAKVASSLPRIARENGISRTEFSPHDIPGEGEQKIAEYIRQTREEGVGKIRGIYGLDADLIMISLLLDSEDPPSN